MKHSLRTSAGIMCLCVGLMGCGGNQGPPRFPVKGSVSFEGTPVADGRISFVPASETKGPSAGGIIQNGNYVIEQSKGPTAGEYTVEIRAERETGEVAPGSDTKGMGGIMLKEPYIPDKYNRNSTLTVNIQDGDNTHDFDLEP